MNPHKFFFLISCFLLLCTRVPAQFIYICSDTGGNHSIHADAMNDTVVKLATGYCHKINFSSRVEVSFQPGENGMIRYELNKKNIITGDTFYLEFKKFHTIDTIFYSSSCTDGSESENWMLFDDINPGSEEIRQLPKYLYIRTNRGVIQLKKKQIPFTPTTSGNGYRNDKPWGFVKTTRQQRVVYVN